MLKMVLWPDPVLKQVSEPCVVGDKSLKRLSKQMAQLMYKTNGCGIAAPQVGLNKRMIVIDCEGEDYYGKDPLVLVNPVIVETQGEPEDGGEGCLSLPGITVEISRAPWVRVQYYDLDGELWEIAGDGLLGRCLQHEIDHLDGKTIMESATPDRRIQAIMDLEAARAAGAKPGDVDIAEDEDAEE